MTIIKPERTDEIDQADDTATADTSGMEGQIREFVRRDVSVFRRSRNDSNEPAVESVTSLIHRVSGASVAEIERVIAELGGVRDMLRNEGDRVQREIAGYASLSQATMTSMKIIADSLAQLRPQTAQLNRSSG